MSIPPKPPVDKIQRFEYLTDTSPKDKPWDQHRHHAESVERHLKTAPEGWIEKQGSRVEKCAEWLKFLLSSTPQGEAVLRLTTAQFCHVRTCPVCQWRRSLMWKARFHEAVPAIMQNQTKGRWLFLTLTARNCPITDLRSSIKDLNESWQRLLKRKEFKHVIGWIRATEVTRGDNDTAHPHFHCLLWVKGTYFKPEHYIKTEDWSKVWGECMRVDYAPIVDIRVVRDKTTGKVATVGPDLGKAVAETLKYSVKSSDLSADADWLLELVRQTRHLRFIASGGALKDALRQNEPETDADLIGEGDEAIDAEAPVLRFRYHRPEHRYRRRRAVASVQIGT